MRQVRKRSDESLGIGNQSKNRIVLGLDHKSYLAPYLYIQIRVFTRGMWPSHVAMVRCPQKQTTAKPRKQKYATGPKTVRRNAMIIAGLTSEFDVLNSPFYRHSTKNLKFHFSTTLKGVRVEEEEWFDACPDEFDLHERPASELSDEELAEKVALAERKLRMSDEISRIQYAIRHRVRLELIQLDSEIIKRNSK